MVRLSSKRTNEDLESGFAHVPIASGPFAQRLEAVIHVIDPLAVDCGHVPFLFLFTRPPLPAFV
jgi:hypothetical protein